MPAGGDEPDRIKNEKFDQKLNYLSEMKDYFHKNSPKKSILVGDLNIAPFLKMFGIIKKWLKLLVILRLR